MRNDLQDLDGGDVRHELPLTEAGISPAEEAVSCCGGGRASTAAGESPAEAAILAGDDIKTVQGNLGHATAAFTLDIYGHVTDQMRSASARRMQTYLQRFLDSEECEKV